MRLTCLFINPDGRLTSAPIGAWNVTSWPVCKLWRTDKPTDQPTNRSTNRRTEEVIGKLHFLEFQHFDRCVCLKEDLSWRYLFPSLPFKHKHTHTHYTQNLAYAQFLLFFPVFFNHNYFRALGSVPFCVMFTSQLTNILINLKIAQNKIKTFFQRFELFTLINKIEILS